MRNEHFGISLVEAMAAGERALPPNFTRDFGSDFVGAGAVVIAHKSGGPRDDICLEQVTAAASAFSRAFSASFVLLLSLPKAAAAKFYKGCSDAIQPYMLCEDAEGYADAIIR
jgi:hypothetical protein